MSIITRTLQRCHLGEPVVRDALTIVPLILDTESTFAQDYMPLAAALERGTARVTELSEGGSVPSLMLHNDGDLAVFILDGEELVGAKQNRISNVSILAPAKHSMPIPVSCVERGRWSYRTREFSSSPYRIYAMAHAKQMSAVTASLRASGAHSGDQSEVWSSVAEQSVALRSPSPTDSMFDAYETRRKSLNELLEGLEPVERQVGALFGIGDRVVGAEFFESPTVFASFFRKIVSGYAMDSYLRHNQGTVDPNEFDLLLSQLQSVVPMPFPAVGLGDDLRLEDTELTGAALTFDDRIIHLAAFRRAH